MVNTTGIRFLYEFSLGEYKFENPGGNVLSVTSQASGDHDKKNLTTTPLRETFRTSSVATWQEVIMEVNDDNVVPNVFAILNHNLTEAAVVQIQGSTLDTFAAPAFTITIPWNE
jgi:rRNA maturation endonuclease Nob1